MASSFLNVCISEMKIDYVENSFSDRSFELRYEQKNKCECCYVEYNTITENYNLCHEKIWSDSALGYCFSHCMCKETKDIGVLIRKTLTPSFSRNTKRRIEDVYDEEIDILELSEEEERVLDSLKPFEEGLFDSGFYTFIGKSGIGKTETLKYLIEKAVVCASTVTIYSTVIKTRILWKRFFVSLKGFCPDIKTIKDKSALRARLENIEKRRMEHHVVIFDDFVSEYNAKGIKNEIDNLYSSGRHRNIWAFSLLQQINRLNDRCLLDNSVMNFVFKSTSRKTITNHIYEKIFSMATFLPDDEKEGKEKLVSVISELRKGDCIVSCQDKNGNVNGYFLDRHNRPWANIGALLLIPPSPSELEHEAIGRWEG